jgi:hypothetical protein
VVRNAFKGNIFLKPLHFGQYLKFKPDIIEELTDQNSNSQVQCKLNLGNACYNSFQDILHSHLLKKLR